MQTYNGTTLATFSATMMLYLDTKVRAPFSALVARSGLFLLLAVNE